MLEEAGYNPFVEGADVDVKADQSANNNNNNNNNNNRNSFSFIESDFSYASNGRRLSYAENSPATSASTSSPRTSVRTGSPSLRLTLPSPSSPVEEEENTKDLENPFVNETISLNEDPAVPKSPTMAALPPGSPLKVSTDRHSPRLPSSPLASSSPSKNELRNSAFIQQRSVVTVEKAEWVPDSHSLVCEHCRDEFTFIRRRHHCRVCGHLYCGECIVKLTLPSNLNFDSPEKTCVRCAYRVIQVRSKGNFSSTIKKSEDPSISQKLSGKMQNWMYKVSGMHEDGKLDRLAAKISTPHHFSLYQTDRLLFGSKISLESVISLTIASHHDASTVPATAYIPKGDGPFSVLVYIPGGNFVLRDETGVETFCKEICSKVGCIVISVEYRLAPEYQFPTQWEDCYSVVKWVSEMGAQHELPKIERDPKIAVCGEGAGGLLAAAVCQMARDRGSHPPIRYQLLITPWLNISTFNIDKLEDSYVVTKDLMKWVMKQVFKEYGDRDKPYVSPLITSSHANLPQTKIITAGHDPLRYDAEEYANEMRKGDVQVSVSRYENSMHGFIGNYADSHDELEEGVFECIVSLREAFGKGEPVGASRSSASLSSISS